MSAKKLLSVGLVMLGGTGATLSIVAARFEPTAAPGAKIGEVPIGGLSRDQVAFRLRQWWETEKQNELTLRLPNSSKTFKGKPNSLGLTIDDVASVDQVEFRDFWDSAKAIVDKSDEGKFFEVKFKASEVNLSKLKAFVKANEKPPSPAKAVYTGGKIVRTPESVSQTLDEGKVQEAVLSAMKSDGVGEIPLTVAQKKVSDADLAKITGVIAEYTTRFSEGNVSRSSNIRTASSKINGLVLAPGEVFSFNGTVGRRTVEAGFKVAGVYKNGKHDVDLGGGICQVSSTLYNAALYSNLDIKSRSNHSMPVPYVPLGRDATVDYGSIDLKITNSYDFPIALSSHISSGTITFRVLGVKQEGLKVEMLASGARSWGTKEQIIKDPTLPAGKTKVIERGCMGQAISTVRVATMNGKEIRREKIGESYYRGANRIIAVGTQPVAKPVTAPPVTQDAASSPIPVAGDI